MDLNDLLAEVDGIGADQYVPSAAVKTALAEPAPVERLRQPDPVPANEAPTGLSVAQMLGVTPAAPAPQFGSLEMVLDVELDVQVELGQARVPLKQLLRMHAGDQLALDQRPDDPVKIFVNDRLVAFGEPLVVDGALAVKVVSIQAGGER